MEDFAGESTLLVLREIFAVFLRLGLTSFGGPIAHLAYFNREFVHRRKWLDEPTFARVVALSQMLPGPASSQVGMIVGYIRGGVRGAALAWLAFTLPSALLLTAFAFGVARVPGVAGAAWIHGLLIAAVAVVAVAASSMFRTLCPDAPRKSIALIAAAFVLLLPASGVVQLLAIVLGALIGRFFLRPEVRAAAPPRAMGSRLTSVLCGALYVALLLAFALLPRLGTDGPLSAFGASTNRARSSSAAATWCCRCSMRAW